MKWRKFKKVFKKKIRPSLIGLTVMIDEKTIGKILDVYVSPAGGNKVQYSFVSAPTEPVQISVVQQESEQRSSGWSASYTCELTHPSKQLVDYLLG